MSNPQSIKNMSTFLQWIGNQKDWLTVIFSFSAIMLSILSLVYQMSINSKNQERDFLREQKSQAINVSLWKNNKLNNEEKGNITISNSKVNAIYDVFIFSVSNRASGTIEDLSSLVKNNGDDYFKECQYIEILPPGTSQITMDIHNSMGGEHSVQEMIFKDSNGTTWFRNKNGNLEKIDTLYKLLSKYNISGPYSQYSKEIY